jgi:hypothetical protein
VKQSADRVKDSAARVAQSEEEQREELTRLEDETRVLMRDLGFNLMLVDHGIDHFQLHDSRVPNIDLPEKTVQALAEEKRLNLVTHLVGTLRGKTDWQGRQVLLVGWLPEIPQTHMKHESPMGITIEPGTVLLGYQLGQGKKEGDTVEIAGKPFRVAQVLPEQGTDEDIAINLSLQDAQTVLNKPGKINAIMALECRCPIDALPLISQQMQLVCKALQKKEGDLPELVAIRDRTRADGRAAMRGSVAEKHQQVIASQKAVLAEREKSLQETMATLKETVATREDTVARREKVQGLMVTLASVVTPLAVLVSAIWVGLLALSNVRERRSEIGLFRALGKGASTIAALFLGKALLVGILGAAVGVLLGAWTAQWFGARVLEVASDRFALGHSVLLIALLGAPLLSAMASYLPTLSALLQDPAVVLRDQ